jgi:DNA modification methylase
VGRLRLRSRHRVLCGDSTKAEDVERLMDGEKADAIVTDPPYGVAYRSNWKNKFEGIEIAGDETVETRDQSLSIFDGIPALVFGSWKQPKPKGVRAILIWDKGTVGMGAMDVPWFPSTEEIYVLGSGWVGSRVSSVLPFYVRNQHHPTEKPVELLGHLLQRCPDGLIVDPFLGSGTTLIAAEQLDRRCFGMEIDPSYCDIIVKRWENLTGEKAVLADA